MKNQLIGARILLFLGFIVLALVVSSLVFRIGRIGIYPVNAASTSPEVLTAGQNAAILGAEQLLLLTPYNQVVYLPLVIH
jgi:hypothetical protein